MLAVSLSGLCRQPTLLEMVLRVQGDFRRRLAPISVMPLQTGVMLYLHRHVDAKLKDAAAALGVQSPTLAGVIQDLVRKHWVTNRRSIHDDRALCRRLPDALPMAASPLWMTTTRILWISSPILTICSQVLPIAVHIPSIRSEIVTIPTPILAIGS